MRILVTSDTHGRETRLATLLRLHPEADALIFLGDGTRAAAAVVEEFPHVQYYAVRGNNDLAGMEPDCREEFFSGQRVWMTHGHLHSAKRGLSRVIESARACRADILLFGHTHTALYRYEDGVYILNPGSLGYGGNYGVLDITAAGVAVHTAQIEC